MSKKNKEPKVYREFKPKSQNQTDYIRAVIENDIVFCSGPAGSGKTACAVGVAVDHLINEKVEKLIFTRPTVGTDDGDRGLGYLPGDIRDKMDPYLRPIYDELGTYFDKYIVEDFIRKNTIEIAPLDYMRGRTFHNSFVIMDEAQNATHSQLTMFTTRLGSRSKMIVNGDTYQHDRRDEICALDKWMNKIVCNIPGIAVVKLDKSDIVRHRLVSAILIELESNRF